MCPNWNTQERGQNRDEEDSYYEETGWDGLSCADFQGLPGHGIRDVEDLTLLSGIQHYEDGEEE